jgi:peptidoglycan/LPS O-acetylase OafA/YrhL
VGRDSTPAPLATAHGANNFDLLRLFAALLVLWSHAHTFTGRPEPVFLSSATLGPLGVFIFFVISGYLVSMSWDADPHFGRFLQRRLLRLIPALAVVVLLSMFVLGPLLTTLPLGDYFGHRQFWKYLLNIVLYPVYYLPGMFAGMRVPGAINGSLWSLPAEFTMYLVLAVAGMLGARRWTFLLLGILAAAATVPWALATAKAVRFYGMDLRQVVMCAPYFAAGVCAHRFHLERWLSLTGVCVAFVALLAAEHWPEWMRTVSWIALPYLVLAFGLARSGAARILARFGDWSYGVYIYAFPIQQTVLYLRPDIGFVAYVALTALLTLACGAASWHLIEVRALAHKPKRPPLAVETPVAVATT